MVPPKKAFLLSPRFRKTHSISKPRKTALPDGDLSPDVLEPLEPTPAMQRGLAPAKPKRKPPAKQKPKQSRGKAPPLRKVKARASAPAAKRKQPDPQPAPEPAPASAPEAAPDQPPRLSKRARLRPTLEDDPADALPPSTPERAERRLTLHAVDGKMLVWDVQGAQRASRWLSAAPAAGLAGGRVLQTP